MPALSGGSLAIADRDFFVGARGISTQARRGGGSIAACARFVQQRSKNHCINILDGAQFGDENTRPFPDPKSGEAVAEGYSSGQRGQTVNLLTNVYGGSNPPPRSEEHTSELQSLMRISYAVFCLKKKKLA